MSRTLGVLAEEALSRLGDHESLHFDGATLRSGQILDRGRRAGGGLARLGVEPGERVVVLMANCPEVLVAYHAIWRAGATVTPVVFLVTAAELAHILTDSEAAAVITTGDFLGKVAEAAAGVRTLRRVIVAGDSATPASALGVAVSDFADLEGAAAAEPVDRSESDLAALMYTGGTTGRSKGVMLSHANLWSSGHSAWSAARVPGVTRAINPLPISHAYGMLVTVSAMHADEPGFSVLMRWFDAAEWLRLAAEHRVQRAAVVPAMAQLLLGAPLERYDLSALRYIGIGAAPLAAETIAQLEARIPGAQVLEGYGCTETGGIISSNPPAARRLGTVGRPVPGYSVRILDDRGAEVPDGQPGEIAARGGGVMVGYWRSPEASAAALRDGEFLTGDIGVRDPDGYLRVVDRKKDLVIRGGFNVYPRDVEDALVEHPAVAIAGVVGRPDPVLGEEVVAFVTLRPGASAEPADLVAFARTRVGAHKYPREIHIVDAVPLTSVGKLDRKALRSQVR